MGQSNILQSRLKFFHDSVDSPEIFKTLTEHISADTVEDLIDEFYSRDLTGRELTNLFADTAARAHFVGCHKAHIRQVMSGIPAADAYQRSVDELVGAQPQDFGVPWVVACWRFLVDALIPRIVDAAAAPAGETDSSTTMIRALNGASYFDINTFVRLNEAVHNERQREQLSAVAQEIEAEVQSAVGTVLATTRRLQENANTMVASVEGVNTYFASVAQECQAAWGNVQSVASATEQMAASVQEIAQQVSKSRQVTHEAVETADQTNHTIDGMQQAATQIGKIIQLISDIASQTNLLALNATIEASRAGDAGRGFAVVASEVKSLASQTKKATEDISEEIANMQSVTSQAVTTLESVGGAIRRVEEYANAIAAAIEEQSAASQEISGNVQSAASGTANVSTNMSEMTDSTEQVGKMAADLESMVADIDAAAGGLDSKIRNILNNLRSRQTHPPEHVQTRGHTAEIPEGITAPEAPSAVAAGG